MKHVQIDASTVAMILDGILYGDDSGFEEALEQGYEAIETLSSNLRESGKTFDMLVAEDD